MSKILYSTKIEKWDRDFWILWRKYKDYHFKYYKDRADGNVSFSIQIYKLQIELIWLPF